MPMHPGVYADLLSEKMDQHGSTAWFHQHRLVRWRLRRGKPNENQEHRAMLNAALDGDLDG